jgi:hypothetical protein
VSTDFSIKPVGAPATPIVPPAGEAADNAVATELLPVLSVTPARALRQLADEAVLRRRAYFRALDLTKSAPTGLLATDRKA